MMDWDQVRVFLAVSRSKQLAKAAGRLGLDVSTVSRRLDRLEEDLGVALFDRGKDGTTLTAAAEGMLPAAEDMERAMTQFAMAKDAIETIAEGVVRLTCMPGVADAFIAPALAEFRMKYPRVVVELDSSIGYADLTRREADLAVRANRPTSGNELVAVRIVQTRAIPMTSPAYAKELGRVKRWSDARWIAWGHDLAHLPIARWMQKHVDDAAPVFRTSHFQSQLAAASSGLGVVLASAPFQRVHRLVELEHARNLTPSYDELPIEDLWLVGHRALRTVPRITALWEFLLAHLSQANEPR